MHREKTHSEEKFCMLELAELIYSNHLAPCSRTALESEWNFASHLVFVSHHTEREKLQTHLLKLLASEDYGSASSPIEANSIIYPKIVIIKELYNQLTASANSDFLDIQNHLQNTSILQIALKYFIEGYQHNKLTVHYELEFIIQKLSLLNNLLKYKSKDEIFASHEVDLAWIFQTSKDKDLPNKILDELPNMKNQKAILALNLEVLKGEFQYVYQLISCGQHNLLHNNLYNKLSKIKNFHLLCHPFSTMARGKGVFKKASHNECKNECKKIDFTSTRHYEEALSYLIEKDLDSADNHNKLATIVCDDEELARRIHSHLTNHGSFEQRDVELCGYRNIYSDIAVQCFIKLGKLIFGKVDINDYVDFITNSLLRFYDIGSHFITPNMHGVRVNFTCFEDLCQNFAQQYKASEEIDSSQNKSTDKPIDNSIYKLNSILIAARNKVWSSTFKHKSFLSKVILLSDIFKDLVDEEQISTRNLYHLQEIAYQIKLKGCSKDKFLDILQHLALSIAFKSCNNEASIPKVKITKSTQLDSVDHALEATTMYLVHLDINLHLGAQKYLNLKAESQYKYDPLKKLIGEIAADNIILFHDSSTFRDGINFQLLQLDSIDGDHYKLERQIAYPHSFDSASTNDVNNEDDLTLSPISLLEEKDTTYFIKPDALKISSIYVTALRRLFNDPQSYFVQDILKIRPIDEFNDYSYKKHFGIMCHNVLDSTTKHYSDAQSAQNGNAFVMHFAKEFESVAHLELNEEHYLATSAKVEQIAKNVLENLNFDAENTMQEKEISHMINVDGKAIRILARVDRMERSDDNICVIDYKTGALPTISAIKNFEDPQMVGEAYIIYKMGFDSANDTDFLAHTFESVKNIDYKYFTKLIKVNATSKACIELDVTDIIPKFEGSVTELIREYLIKEDAKF